MLSVYRPRRKIMKGGLEGISLCLLVCFNAIITLLFYFYLLAYVFLADMMPISLFAKALSLSTDFRE